jgi:choice-of-anchor B domain-containing protein
MYQQIFVDLGILPPFKILYYILKLHLMSIQSTSKNKTALYLETFLSFFSSFWFISMKPKRWVLGLILVCLGGCTLESSPSNGGETEEVESDFEAANNPCENNLAADLYPCVNISLYAHISPEDLGGQQVNDIWGWVDPETSKEYALVGLTDGVSFVDVTKPNEPIVVGKLDESDFPLKYSSFGLEDFPACNLGLGSTTTAKAVVQGTAWRDMKVFNDHMFVVSDGQIHGMQVFDLTRLRSFEGSFMQFKEDALYKKLGNAHNIAINEASGYAYAIGVTQADTCGSRNETGLHMIDINDPKNPTFAGCYADPATEFSSSVSAGIGYIHDTQCLNYQGPDDRYTGKELCFSSAEGAVVITDVSDKNNPLTLSASADPSMEYSHQGWLTEDHRYFLMNDELDELNFGRNTKTYIWDVSNINDPAFLGYHTHNTPSIDHNLYVHEEYVLQSNYTSGLRIFNLHDVDKARLNEVAYFDSEPSQNDANFSGTWSNYPYLPSGVILLSDIYNGLFILRPDYLDK